MLGEPPPPLPHLDGTVLVTLLGFLGSLGTLRYDICYFLSLSSIWRWSTAKALTLSSPRAPWPFPCPRQGSRPLRFCGLQTPHPRGQSGQKPPLWGVLLGEGTGILWFLPAGSRLLSGQAPGFKTSYMCKNKDIPHVHQVPRPFPNPARCFSWRDPVAYINSGACFPRDVARALLLDQR